MSIPLVVNGVTYNYPEEGDEEWGDDATAWAEAITAAVSSLTIADLAADPSPGSPRQFYWHTVEGILKFFDGTTAYGVALV